MKNSRNATGIAVDLLLPLLALLAPFLVFMEYHQYGYFNQEIFIIVAGLSLTSLVISCGLIKRGILTRAAIITALLLLSFTAMYSVPYWLVILASAAASTLFRQNLAAIVTAGLAGICLSTLLIAEHGPTATTIVANNLTQANSSSPPWIHIILDEHMGPEGFPEEIVSAGDSKEELKTFYLERGFTLFGGAYSRYFETDNAISNLVNLQHSDNAWTYIDWQADRRIVRTNAYFAELGRRGYLLNVYQSAYLDFCAEQPGVVSYCYTYPYNSISSIRQAKLTAYQKAPIILAYFAESSQLYQDFRTAYRALYNNQTINATAMLPKWDWQGNLIVPEAGFAVSKQLALALSQAKPGNAYFVHLLLPHHPYVYDANCEVQAQLTKRLSMHDPSLAGLSPNTTHSRSERYSKYFEQMECTSKRIAALLDAIDKADPLGNATIIVQGDHGSRITTHMPFSADQPLLTDQNIKDSFSTLFAVRRPAAKARYQPCWIAMENLLINTLEGDRETSPSCDEKPFVYLQNMGTDEMITLPMPPG